MLKMSHFLSTYMWCFFLSRGQREIQGHAAVLQQLLLHAIDVTASDQQRQVVVGWQAAGPARCGAARGWANDLRHLKRQLHLSKVTLFEFHFVTKKLFRFFCLF